MHDLASWRKQVWWHNRWIPEFVVDRMGRAACAFGWHNVTCRGRRQCITIRIR